MSNEKTDDGATVPRISLLACAYCGKERPQAEMIQRKVMHYHTQRHLDKMMWYCKEGGCVGYHQMSLEG
jgi:hypothetical protein